MINKIYKTINNKYSKFFKFLFFLKYVFVIFLIAILLFLLIPKFFNYQKKQEILKDYLVNHYDLELLKYDSIKFKVFPLPNLHIKDVNLKVKNKPVSFNTKNLNIFLNFENIYNYTNFEARKILLNGSKATLDIDKTNELFVYLNNLKYKFDVKKLNLNFKKGESSIIEIKKIYFSNYGYQKNKIMGEVFDKKFRVSLDSNNKDLNLKILNTGINANFNYEKNQDNLLVGLSKINILNNYLRFNFLFSKNRLEILKANLRNKDLSIFFDSSIQINPFFEISSNIEINKIDKKLIENFNLEKLLENKEVLKKFNSINKVNYKKKKRWHRGLIESHFSEFSLAYGNLVFLNKTSIPGGVVNCKGDVLLTEEYPRLNFQCFADIKDKEKFLKNFIPSQESSEDKFNFNVSGSLNLLNKKINFEKIYTDNKYIANEEDIIFFKKTFEQVLFNENFLKIFSMRKIREFLLEII